MKATCSLALFLRIPPVKTTCSCCVTAGQSNVQLGNYLCIPPVKATCCCMIGEVLVCTIGEGNMLWRDCFVCTTGEGNVFVA